jgi:hypothetical protein
MTLGFERSLGLDGLTDVSRDYTFTDWRTAGLVFLVSFTVYLGTLAPTITLEYSGQLVVAADHLGVARPPGYPIWHLLAKTFATIFAFVEYRGHPNPAWAVNVMSAVFGALACGTMALMISRETRHLLCGPSGAETNYSTLVCAASAFAAALLFGFSPAMWSQSVVAETHTLTNFHLLLFLAVLLPWTERREDRRIYVISFLFGLGLSISYLLALLAPAMILAAMFVSRRATIQLVAATTAFALFIATEFALGQHSPQGAALVLGATLGATILLLIPRLTRSASLMLLLMFGGLLPYAYLPLAASHNPPMNMGYACTWEGFWHVLNRGQYERIVPLNPFTHAALFTEQLFWYFRLASSQYAAPIASMALVPVVALPFLRRAARRSVILPGFAFCFFSVVTLLGVNPRLDLQTTFIARVIFIPSFALLAILAGYGLAIMLDGLGEQRAWKHRGAEPTPEPYGASAGPNLLT